MKRLAAIVLLAVVGVCSFFAWFKQKDQDELDEEARLRRRGLDRPGMDEDFAHEVTPADPVQVFRNGGAV